MAEELGDIMFSVVNLARHADCDAEKALRFATRKFESRFTLMESIAKHVGRQLHELDHEDLDRLWRQAKEAEL